MPTSFSILVSNENGWSQTDLNENVLLQLTDPYGEINALQNYLARNAAGAGACSLEVSTSSGTLTAASGTVTCASVQVNDTVTLNGVVFTAVSGTAGANQFDITGDDGAAATGLAAGINASVTALVAGYLSASASSAVVTISSLHSGIMGNQATLSSNNSGRLLTSGARLASGAGGFGATVRTYNYGT